MVISSVLGAIGGVSTAVGAVSKLLPIAAIGIPLAMVATGNGGTLFSWLQSALGGAGDIIKSLFNIGDQQKDLPQGFFADHMENADTMSQEELAAVETEQRATMDKLYDNAYIETENTQKGENKADLQQMAEGMVTEMGLRWTEEGKTLSAKESAKRMVDMMEPSLKGATNEDDFRSKLNENLEKYSDKFVFNQENAQHGKIIASAVKDGEYTPTGTDITDMSGAKRNAQIAEKIMDGYHLTDEEKDMYREDITKTVAKGFPYISVGGTTQNSEIAAGINAQMEADGWYEKLELRSPEMVQQMEAQKEEILANRDAIIKDGIEQIVANNDKNLDNKDNVKWLTQYLEEHGAEFPEGVDKEKEVKKILKAAQKSDLVSKKEFESDALEAEAKTAAVIENISLANMKGLGGKVSPETAKAAKEAPAQGDGSQYKDGTVELYEAAGVGKSGDGKAQEKEETR